MKGQRTTPVGSLPLPQFIPEQERSRLISEVATFITADTDVSHYFNVAKEAIAGYSQDTLHRIMGNLSKSHMNLIVHGFSMDWDEAKINDYISIAAAVENNEIWSEELGWQLKALAYYQDLTPIQPGQAYPLERALQCHAIIEAVSAIHWHKDEDNEDDYGSFTHMDDGEFLPYIQDPQLRDLILYSDDRNEVARIIKERGITDAEVIMEFLHGEAPAIAAGML
jgi:hypothetical protein